MPLLMATSAFGLGRTCQSLPQQCYLVLNGDTYNVSVSQNHLYTSLQIL